MSAETPAVTYHNEGQQINADRVDSITYNILERVRESVEAYALTREQIAHLRDVFVWTAQADEAYGLLYARHRVALIGARGCGRRITAVAVTGRLGVTPHSLYLDPGDRHPDLPEEPGCSYIVEIDEQTAEDVVLSSFLASYAERLAAVGSCLVITTTPDTWSRLDLRMSFEAVTIRPPAPVDVFRSHLRHTHSELAGLWAEHPDVAEALDGASPANAVRLAGLAASVLSEGADVDPVAEALAAYRNWSDQLRTWFGTHEDGYHRALLLAAAALNGADTATVFGAADQLSDLAELPRDPGGRLTGSGAVRLVDEIEGQLTADGTIRLPRPAYPASVLDHVWRDRPYLREDLKRWLAGLPGSLPDSSAQYAGYSLIKLAIRQRDPALIGHAVGVWAQQPRCRALAAAALTEAGVSTSIGREIRRQMYTWANRAGTTQPMQLTIADVCGGAFGKNFPRNAMTRLRHLAINGDSTVRGRVAEAIGSLAEERQLRDFTLHEVVRWATEPGQPQAAGIGAFLAIARILAGSLPERLSPERIDMLADGWRAALRDADHASAAEAVCEEWLEAAARGNTPANIVLTVLARVCQDNYDIGLLAPVARQWARVGGDPAPVPREEIATQLLQMIADRDPLTPGVSAMETYRVTSEEIR